MGEQSVENQISVELKDRTLWFDGDISVSSEKMVQMLLSGKTLDRVFPDEIDSNVKKYNMYGDREFTIKTEIAPLDTSTILPDEYLNINLSTYLFDKLNALTAIECFDNDQIDARILRVKDELSLIAEYDIENLFRTAIYIVDTFTCNDIVWGTGRGSSCACYSLYLIGLHEVDSVLYELELTEFFR